MTDRLLYLAARLFGRLARLFAYAFPPGSTDEATAVFDALQREAFRERGWRGVGSSWLAECLAGLRIAWIGTSTTKPSAGGGGSLALWRDDLRAAWRFLRRSPGYTLTIAGLLALGIGMNTALFSIVDALLFKALPYTDSDRLVLVAEWPKDVGGNWTAAPPVFADWQKRADGFSALEARLDGPMALVDAGDPEAVSGARVSAGYFGLLGVHPSEGRLFDVDPTRGSCTAVITDRLWARRFGRDPAILGHLVRLDRTPCAIVGVLPNEPALDRGAEVYLPLALTPAEAQRDGRVLTVLGRLRDGVTLAQASAELVSITAVFNTTRGPEGRQWTAAVFPWRDILVRRSTRQLAWLLFGAVAIILAIACTNIAGLSLSRAIARRREIAVRAALGASRVRIFRVVLTESLLLAAVGGVAALFSGQITLRLLLALMPVGTLPGEITPTLDGRALVFTAAVAVLTGLLAGLVPAWQAGHVTLTDALASTGRGFTGSRHSSRLQAALLVGEIASATVLVTGAALLTLSFARLTEVAPGFTAQGVLTMRLSASPAAYRSDAEVTALFAGVRRALVALPTVEAAGAATSLPLGGWLYGSTFTVDGQPFPQETPAAHIQSATAGYFEALQMTIADGRGLADRDESRSPLVAVVNQTLVRRFIPIGAAVGQRLRLVAPGTSTDAPWLTIVGVVRDVKTNGLTDADLAIPEIYVPLAQGVVPDLFFAIRAKHGDPRALLPDVRAAVRSVDPSLPVADVAAMDERLTDSLKPARFRTTIIGAFAALAALLACLGAYAVRSRAVAARVREMGIRGALGATGGQLLRMVLGQGLRLVGAGLVLGLIGSIALQDIVKPWAFETGTADPAILIAAMAALGGAALLATWLPARRAAAVAPWTVLRDD